MDEKKQLSLLQKSSEKALEILIRKYTAYVSTVIYNQLGNYANRTIVEELVSDVFLAMWENRKLFVTSSIKAWLGVTARNKAKNYIRSQKIVFEEISEDTIVCSEDNVFDKLEQKEQSAVISAALSQMKPKEQELLIRYYFYNQTVKQISEETDTNIVTVKSILSRARQKLKTILEEGGYFK